jgi:hypothetical protein
VVINLTPPAAQRQGQPFISFSEDCGISRVCIAPSGVGDFTVSNGKEISFQADSSGKFSSFLPLYLTGSILSLLLYQRGLLVLHGSVVQCKDKVLAFLGHSGAGKSSAAAACCQQGYNLLSDDIAALSLLPEASISVYSGFPRLKVPVQTARALDLPIDSLTAVHPDLVDEFEFPLHGRFCPDPQPLAAIYLLEQGAEVMIEQCAPAKALLELLPHAMPSRYGLNGGACQFEQLSTLVREVPVFHLVRPVDLQQLHQLPEVVENHLLQLS